MLCCFGWVDVDFHGFVGVGDLVMILVLVLTWRPWVVGFGFCVWDLVFGGWCFGVLV